MTRNEINEGRSWNGDLVTPTLDQENLELAEQVLAEAKAAKSQREEAEKDFAETCKEINTHVCPFLGNNLSKQVNQLKAKNTKLARSNRAMNERLMSMEKEISTLRTGNSKLQCRVAELREALCDATDPGHVDFTVRPYSEPNEVEEIDLSTATIQQVADAMDSAKPGLTTTSNLELTKAEGQQAVKEAVKEILDLFDKYKFLFK